jgi:hypothetical protein
MTRLAYDSAKLTAAIKAGHSPELFRRLKQQEGISFDALRADDIPSPHLRFVDMPKNAQAYALDGLPLIGQDAPPAYVQSELVTVPNAGIPWFLANWVDPKVIAVLVAPMMAAKIAGEALKGDWLTETAMFLTAEAVGDTSAYGDYSESGSSNVNPNFPQRQNFLFQCFLQYGQREVGRFGLAKLDWVSQQQSANALTLMKALNFLYFYGVNNLQNYGLINDPFLPPPLTPVFSWLTNASATANTIYQDVVRMFIQLQQQSQGTVRLDDPMVLAMSPENAVALKEVTLYNTNSVEMLLKQNFPNLRIETAPEYGPPYNAAGQLVQLIVDEVEGHRTVECSFSSKMMAHNMVVGSSSWRQKRSSGGFGAVWYRRFLQVQMLG